MIRSCFRSAAAVVLGLIVAFVLVVALEGFSAVAHPFPDGELDIREHVANYPQWVLAVVVLCLGVTTFLAVWLATRWGTRRHPAHGWFVGLLLLAAVALNTWMLPYPSWFEFANYLVFPAAIVLGLRRGRQPVGRPDAHR